MKILTVIFAVLLIPTIVNASPAPLAWYIYHGTDCSVSDNKTPMGQHNVISMVLPIWDEEKLMVMINRLSGVDKVTMNNSSNFDDFKKQHENWLRKADKSGILSKCERMVHDAE